MSIRSATKAPHRSYQICSRCVMDTSDPWIEFDEQGRCNHCRQFLDVRLAITAQYTPNPHRLEQLWASIPRSSGQYDVIVGVSGGVDSSLVALLAQQAGLRVLAVHMDNGWDTPISLQNVYRLATLSGITYKSEVLDWNSFKAVQRAFIEAGVPDIELPTDIAIQAVLHRAALRYGVRVILSGGNVATEGILPECWMYNPRDSLYAESIVAKADLPHAFYAPLKFGFRQELRCRLLHRVRTLYPLNYFLYSKDEARQRLAAAIGWKSYGGKHCESTYTRFCQLIYQPRRHNVDYRRCHLSVDICLDSISRDEALVRLSGAPWADLNVDRDVSFVARKLGYTYAGLCALMDSPPRWYVDFPRRKRMLGLSYSAFRLLTGRRKTSNF